MPTDRPSLIEIALARAARRGGTVTPPAPELTDEVYAVRGSAADGEVLTYVGGRWEGRPPSGSAGAVDVGYDVILGLGQSNMSGSASDFDTTNIDVPEPGIFQWAADGPVGGFPKPGVLARSIEPLGHPDYSLPGHTANMGPLHEFARWYRLSQPNRRVIVVPAAYGGTPFEGADSHAAGKSWKVSAGAGNLLANAIALTQAAIAAGGAGSKLVAILWVHGEQDTTNGTSGATYRADLEAMIDYLRTQLAAPAVPFVIGQMLANRGASIDLIQAATPTRKPYTAYAAGPAPAGTYVDPVNGAIHYNAAGQRKLARAMFDQLDDAKANASPTPPAVDVAAVIAEAVKRLRASDITGVANGAAVAAWGSFAQATAAARPTLDTGTGEVVFDGVNDVLDDPAFARPTDSTVFVVGRLTALPGASNFWIVGNIATTTQLNLGAAASAPKDFLANAGTSDRSGVVADTAQHVLGAVFGANGAVRVDGVDVPGNTGANANAGARLGGSGAFFTPVRLKQVLFWNRVLSAAERAAVATYLAANPA